MARKAHPASKLKLLDDALQDRIFEVCSNGTYKEAIEWLREEMGIIISDSALSDWYGWKLRKLALGEAESETKEIQELLSRPGLQLSPEQLAGIANAIFINRATKNADAKTFALVAGVVQRSQEFVAEVQAHEDKMRLAKDKLAVKREELSLAERRVKVLEERIEKVAMV